MTRGAMESSRDGCREGWREAGRQGCRMVRGMGGREGASEEGRAIERKRETDKEADRKRKTALTMTILTQTNFLTFRSTEHVRDHVEMSWRRSHQVATDRQRITDERCRAIRFLLETRREERNGLKRYITLKSHRNECNH